MDVITSGTSSHQVLTSFLTEFLAINSVFTQNNYLIEYANQEWIIEFDSTITDFFLFRFIKAIQTSSSCNQRHI